MQSIEKADEIINVLDTAAANSVNYTQSFLITDWVSAVEFDLPAEIPVPAIWASQPSGEIVTIGSGAISNSANPALGASDGVKLYNSSGTYKIKIESTTALSASHCWCQISWLVAS